MTVGGVTFPLEQQSKDPQSVVYTGQYDTEGVAHTKSGERQPVQINIQVRILNILYTGQEAHWGSQHRMKTLFVDVGKLSAWTLFFFLFRSNLTWNRIFIWSEPFSRESFIFNVGFLISRSNSGTKIRLFGRSSWWQMTAFCFPVLPSLSQPNKKRLKLTQQTFNNQCYIQNVGFRHGWKCPPKSGVTFENVVTLSWTLVTGLAAFTPVTPPASPPPPDMKVRS